MRSIFLMSRNSERNPMNKFEIKSQNTKRALVNAFWELTREKELHKIKIKDVTDRAGVYRSTFYLHFVDILDLLEQEEDLLVEKWQIHAAHVPDLSSSNELFLTLSNYYIENGDKVFTLLNNRAYSKYEEKMKDSIRKMIYSQYAPANVTSFEYSFEFYIDGIIGSLCKWHSEGQSEDVNVVIAQMLNLIQHGIGNAYWKTDTSPSRTGDPGTHC